MTCTEKSSGNILKLLQCGLILHVLKTKKLVIPSEMYLHSKLAYEEDVIHDPDLVEEIRRCLYWVIC